MSNREYRDQAESAAKRLYLNHYPLLPHDFSKQWDNKPNYFATPYSKYVQPTIRTGIQLASAIATGCTRLAKSAVDTIGPAVRSCVDWVSAAAPRLAEQFSRWPHKLPQSFFWTYDSPARSSHRSGTDTNHEKSFCDCTVQS